MTPQQFITETYHVDLRGAVKLSTALRAYRASLPHGMTISREGFLSAISDRYPVGRLSDGTLAIAGISETPARVLNVDADGRLRLVAA